ncbi:MAG: histidine phosphatase family protein [Clostridia bacterium]|nr:histidine phosphatase family protein [Clostridia bacterium]
MENITPIKELELYIIRHGQSMGNAGYDRTDLTETEIHDPILTQKGIEQADKAGRYLCDVEFDYIFSSAMLRAVQTATGIIKYQKKAKTLNILPIVCEMGIPAEYLGVTMDELKKINPEVILAPDVSVDTPMIYHTGEEEDTFERARTALEYICSRYKNGEKVAVVSHAAFITYLVFSLMGYDKAPLFDIDFHNTGITKVVFYKKDTNKYGDIVFEKIDDTAHYMIEG